MHSAKLLRAYKNIPDSVFNNDISVIDWGCGQGLATLLLQEYLDNNPNLDRRISEIVLIEPSRYALSMAEDYLLWSVSDTNLNSINKKEENVRPADFPFADKTTIHLLSNVVDMPEFSGDKVIDYIRRNNNLRHIVICVSPFYPKDGRGTRMYDFGNRLDGFKRIYCFQRHVEDWDEDFSCQIHIYDNQPGS